MFYAVTAPDGAEIFPIKENGEEGRWRISKSRMERIIKSNQVDFVYDENKESWNIYAKKYDGIKTTTAYSSILNISETSAAGTKNIKALFQEKIFDTVKPISLIKYLTYLSNSTDGDIVLDFFAGSCTTAHAVLDLNKEDGGKRKFIMVQLPEPCPEDSEAAKAGYETIADIGKERIRRVIKKIESERAGKLDLEGEPKPDLGFKVFRLDRSNFKVWDSEPKDDAEAVEEQLEMHIAHIDAGASPEDILYELLLKTGFPLTTRIEKRRMADKDVFAIEGGALLICLEKSLTQELIRAMAEANPLRVICLDEGFEGNDQLKTNAVQTFRSRGGGGEEQIVFRTV